MARTAPFKMVEVNLDTGQRTTDAEKASSIVKLFSKARQARINFESHWREVAQYMVPNDSTAFAGQRIPTKGEKRTEREVDSMPRLALEQLVAITDSLITPPTGKWAMLKPADPSLAKHRGVRLFLEEVTDILFAVRSSQQAGFAGQNQATYQSIGAYGSGVTLVEQNDSGVGMSYTSVHMSQAFFGQSSQGYVDVMFRRFPLELRQAWQMWGDKLPESMTRRLEKDPFKEEMFLHLVAPRAEFDPGRADSRNRPYGSYYVAEEAGDGEHQILEESGFSSFPYAIGRWSMAPGEVYGRSPSMNSLPTVKLINEEKKVLIKQAHRAVDPPILLHNDGVLRPSIRPGALNYGGIDSEGRALMQPFPVGRVDLGVDLIEMEYRVINKAFFIELFQILAEQPQMTATEVVERVREKGILLAPVMRRLMEEYLGSLVVREVAILDELGLIPVNRMPRILRDAGGLFELDFDSPASRMMKAEEVAGLNRTLEHVLRVVEATQDPAPLDHFDMDIIVPDLARNNAVPERYLRSLEAVQALRQERNQMSQMKMMTDAAPGAAAMVKAVSAVEKGGRR